MARRKSKRIASQVSTGNRKDQPVPPWFLDRCVTSSWELSSREIPLIVDLSLESTDVGISKEVDSDKYEISSFMWQVLRNVVSTSPVADAKAWRSGLDGEKMHFTNDFLRLSFPGPGERICGFFAALLQYLAKDIGADLIKLSLRDIEDLAVHYTNIEQGIEKQSSIDNSVRRYFSNPSSSATIIEGKSKFPFKELLNSPALKPKSDLKTEVHKSVAPLIIHIPEVLDFSKSSAGSNISTLIRETIRDIDDGDGRILVIGTDKEGPCCGSIWKRAVVAPFTVPTSPNHRDDDAAYCHTHSEFIYPLKFGYKPAPLVIPMIPIPSMAQMQLLERDEKIHIEDRNITTIRRAIKQGVAGDKVPRGLFLPAEWRPPSIITKILQKGVLDDQQCDMIYRSLGGKFELPEIEKAIVGSDGLSESRNMWQTPTFWKRSPDRVQKVISQIAGNDAYRNEGKLIGSIATPDQLTETLQDIEIDPDVEMTAMGMVDLNISDSSSAYGLLKDSKIPGMLLYGPPGTGKTHLVRVMARQSHGVLIHVSAAELLVKWVGDTEKLIKALFNLGRMLYPSIIFIDEADALLCRRSENDHRWGRSQLSQLLLQTDGFEKSSSQPFLILATNHPQDLDPAVLRRVPCRLYMGFPSREARRKILSIHLREEKVDPNVDFGLLADRSRRFTGSDLRNVCIRAAQFCEMELRRSRTSDSTRILQMGHLERALKEIPPTASEDSLRQLRLFAREFDPVALPRIDLEPIQRGSRLVDSAGIPEPTKRKSDALTSNGNQLDSKRQKSSSSTASQRVEEMLKKLPYATSVWGA